MAQQQHQTNEKQRTNFRGNKKQCTTHIISLKRMEIYSKVSDRGAVVTMQQQR